MELESDKIHNEDAVQFISRLPDNSVDLIVTSPPYNIGIDYDSWDDNLSYSDYLLWCSRWLEECYRILKDDGRICINHYLCGVDPISKKSTFPLMDFREIQNRIGFISHKLIIWEDITRSNLTSWGSWLSASAPYINTPYEGILISYKNQWKKLEKGEDTISKESFMSGVSGVWKIRPETSPLTKACFPVEIPKRCIELLSFKNDIVFDPFMGSGTTAIAAIQTNRKFIGSEISENYYNIAQTRIRNELALNDFY